MEVKKSLEVALAYFQDASDRVEEVQSFIIKNAPLLLGSPYVFEVILGGLADAAELKAAELKGLNWGNLCAAGFEGTQNDAFDLILFNEVQKNGNDT